MSVNNQIKSTVIIMLLSLAASTAPAAFTSIHVFGDSLSTAKVNSPVGPDYYGDRWSNGRVWVEVLAQRLGLPFNLAANTNSYWGNTSSDLIGEVSRFIPPAKASDALVVIWVNNADLYFPATAPTPTLTNFDAVISLAQINHYKAITNLYAKGIRNLVMPNVVDISTVPGFNTYTAYTNLFHLASMNYNAKFYATLDRAKANCPGLKIYVPDFYVLLADLLTQPNIYGLTNAKKNGLSIDALGGLSRASLTSEPATSYIFWDKTDPSAKVHSIMASVAQQTISPVQIGLAQLGDYNRIDMINVPVGMSGFLENSTNLATAWTVVTNFNSPAPTQSIFVVAPPLPADFGAGGSDGGGWTGGPPTPGTGTGTTTGTNSIPFNNVAAQLYRLRFPYNWTWP
jgi:phospholipase/lecithinase/hemolysin